MLKEDKKSLKPKTSAINIPDKHIIQKGRIHLKKKVVNFHNFGPEPLPP